MHQPTDALTPAPLAHDPRPADDGDQAGKLTGSTRRSFIRDLAIAGTSTTAALYGLDAAEVVDLVGTAEAADANAPLSEFTAIAPSSADALETPEGIAWSVIIRYGDTFQNTDGTTYTFGYNNDWIGYYPLKGSEEGILFVNHEYPDPFFQHGFKSRKNIGTSASPNFQPRENGKETKSIANVDDEKEATGNSIVHVRRTPEGAWAVVSPSPYNRRVFGGEVPGMPSTKLSFSGPLARAGAPGSSNPDPKVHGVDNLADGSIGNCSGGTTPWGTALSCEENYDGYGVTFRQTTADFNYGWDSVNPGLERDQQQDGGYTPPAGTAEYVATTGSTTNESRKYGWVCEHDPYDASFVGRKHTALGRFRHENTAFRVARGKKFVLYMGDDQTNQAIYKFVSTRAFDPNASREEHLRILTEGQLFVARFAPEGRRRYTSTPPANQPAPPPETATAGTGTWLPVDPSDLFDTRLRLAGFTTGVSQVRRPRQQTGSNNMNPADENIYAGRYNRLVSTTLPSSDPNYYYYGDDASRPANYVNEWDRHFATNRPEDVEVAQDGSVYVALTNNTSTASSGVTSPFANDPYGAVRRLRETENDPEARSFTWEEFAAGGPKPGSPSGEQGFASPDNLVFDSQDNVWVVTDISSASLNSSSGSAAPYQYHKNNAVFLIPRGGEQAGVAYRFANMPIHAEGTGPYFSPDESTLFLTVQHPGEETKNTDSAILGQPQTYTSYWPNGNKTTGTNPSEPLPSLVAIYRQRAVAAPGTGQQPTPAPVPPGNVPAPPAPTADVRPPAVRILTPRRTTVKGLRRNGMSVTVEIDEAATVEVRLRGRVRYRVGRRRKSLAYTTLGSKTTVQRAGRFTVAFQPSVLARLALARPQADVVEERIVVTARDRAGNERTVSRRMSIKR